MSNQRNADKDRRQLAIIKADGNAMSPLAEWTEHWLERAVSAEQRVAELEEFMRLIVGTTKPPYSSWHSAVGHADAIDFAQSALKGSLESEDRP